MTRREYKTTYKASWSLRPGRFPNPLHRIYELTLVVPRKDLTPTITIAFVLDGEKSSCVQDFMTTLEPQLLALRIDIDPTLGTVLVDRFGEDALPSGPTSASKQTLGRTRRRWHFSIRSPRSLDIRRSTTMMCCGNMRFG